MPDFNLLGAPNFAQAALGGYQAGRQIRQQNDRDTALKGYAANPDDPRALTGLVAADPELGIPLMQQHRQSERQREVGRLARLAAGGDHDAAMKLYEMQPDLAKHFDEHQQAMVKEGTNAIGNIALEIAQMPEDQRAAAWDSGVDFLAKTYPELARYRGHYTPENLQGILAQTGGLEKLRTMQQPKLRGASPGEVFFDERTGQEVYRSPYPKIIMGPNGEVLQIEPQGIQGAPNAPHTNAQPTQIRNAAEYQALPPGTHYVDPNGVERVKGGASPQGSRPFP